jgi:hypothetical protein
LAFTLNSDFTVIARHFTGLNTDNQIESIIVRRQNNYKMEFNPNNNIIKLCLQGMDMEQKGNTEEAGRLFLQAWNKATDDFEKFTASYYVARHQKNVSDKLKWLDTALHFALK